MVDTGLTKGASYWFTVAAFSVFITQGNSFVLEKGSITITSESSDSWSELRRGQIIEEDDIRNDLGRFLQEARDTAHLNETAVNVNNDKTLDELSTDSLGAKENAKSDKLEALISPLDHKLQEALRRIETLEKDLRSRDGRMLEIPGQKLQSGQVFFDTYRTKDFYQEKSIITYKGTEINVGEAMDPHSGIFTAKLDGIYLFSFTTIQAWKDKEHRFQMKKNGVVISTMYSTGENIWTPVSMFTIQQLVKGDRVYVYMDKGMCYDTPLERLTRFSGARLA